MIELHLIDPTDPRSLEESEIEPGYLRCLTTSKLLIKAGRVGIALGKLGQGKTLLLERGLFRKASELYGEASKALLSIQSYALARQFAAEAYDLYQGTPDPGALLVEQNECVISKTHSLGTSSIGECVAIAVYHKSSKTIGLAHVDRLTTKSSIVRFLNQLPIGPLEITLIGGSTLNEDKIKISKANLSKISAALKEIGASLHIKQYTMDISHPTAFVIDRNGSIHSNRLPGKHTENRLIRSGLAAFATLERDLREPYEKQEEDLIHASLTLSPDVSDQLQIYRGIDESTITKLYAEKDPISGLITAAEVLALQTFIELKKQEFQGPN